jgi:hypothetical protein
MRIYVFEIAEKFDDNKDFKTGIYLYLYVSIYV